MFVLAAGAVGASAATEFELASSEVVEELVPFVIGGLAIFLGRPGGSATGEERSVVINDVLIIDSNVGLGRSQGLMTEDLRGHVHGQTLRDGFGGEDAAEVVRAEPYWGGFGVGDASGIDKLGKKFFHPLVSDRDITQSPASLEQDRQRRRVEALGAIVPGHQGDTVGVATDVGDDFSERTGQLGADNQEAFLVGL